LYKDRKFIALSKIKVMKRLLSYNPDLLQSWGLLGLVLLCQLIAGGMSGIIPQIFGPEAQSWTNLFAYVLSFGVMALIIILLGKSQNQIVIPVAQKVKARFPLYLLLLLLIPSLSVSIEPLYVWIPMPVFIEDIFASVFTANLPTFISVVIAAPLAEEWLCRGVILKGLLANRMPPYKAIVWSALIFAVIHLNPWQAIPAFCLGFAMGWVYWKTRSLWPCIFMHAVNNGLAFTMLILFSDASASSGLHDIAGAHYPLIYAGAVALSIATGYGVWRMIWVKS